MYFTYSSLTPASSDNHPVNIGCYTEVPDNPVFPEKLGTFTGAHNATTACAQLALAKGYQVGFIIIVICIHS